MIETGKETNHSNVGAITETGFADDGKVGTFPTVSFMIPQQSMRHDMLWWFRV